MANNQLDIANIINYNGGKLVICQLPPQEGVYFIPRKVRNDV